jgi:S-adenosylmethionine/arginine decarboxylase-like enzyme
MMSRKQTSTQKHSTMKQETRPSLMDSTASQHSDFSYAWSEEGETSERKNQFTMKVSGSFASLSLLFAMGLAFVMGRASRLLLIEGPRQKLLQEVEKATEVLSQNKPTVPSLITLDRQKIPQTRYLSKNFDTGLSATMSSWLTIDRNTPDYQQKEDSARGKNESETCTSFGVKEFVESTEPSAQHLMVDIKNVDGSFLNSEPRLAQAIVDLVHEADLPLLSYHCHGFNPLGVSCVGVMMRNYLSFHTWPEAGVITFDIAASESKIILPLLSSIERLFGVARNPTFPGQVTAKPEFRYAYKLRGFRHNPSEIENLFEATDLGDILTILGTDLKEEVSQYGRCNEVRRDAHAHLCF